MSLARILENFAELENDDNRFRYLFQLGISLGPMPKDVYEPQHKVHGCSNQVWLLTRVERDEAGEPVLIFLGDSDAQIVRGLLAIVFELYSSRPAAKILEIDPQPVFAAIGLGGQLSSQRANGLRALISRITNDARDAL
jgi:cysteine desulfuration protein SufE